MAGNVSEQVAAPGNISDGDGPDIDLRKFFHLSLDFLCIAGTDGYFKKVNAVFSETLGFDTEELLTAPFVELVHPEDRDRTTNEVQNLAAGGVTVSFENRYRCKNGSYRRLSWMARADPAKGLIYAAGRDVTAAHAAAAKSAANERWLSALVEAAHDGLIIIDGRGVMQGFNSAAQRVFGYSPVEVIGSNVSMLMPEPDRSQHDGYLAHYRETGEKRVIGIGREVVGRRKDGSLFPLDLAVTELGDGAEQRFLGMVRDISKRQEREAERARLLAQDAHQRGVLLTAAGLLHDLGNVLTGVATLSVDARDHLRRSQDADQFAQLAAFLRQHGSELASALGVERGAAMQHLVETMADVLPMQRKSVLDKVEKMLGYVGHAQELLNAFRTYTGAQAGPGREALHLGAILEDARMLQNDAAAKRKGVISIQTEGKLPALRVERSKLMQVLLNVIKNALEACDDTQPPTVPAIAINAGIAPDGGIEIVIQDNGPGFDPDQAEKLFANDFSSKNRGSGLGLGMARRVIESLDGRFELSSQGRGRGARARIYFPREFVSHES